MIINFSYLKRIDYRVLPIIMALMLVSLLTIASYTQDPQAADEWVTPQVKNQFYYFVLGLGVYVCCAALDYRMLREATWFLYAFMILALIGVFFSPAIHNVHRWYKIPFIHLHFQPSEFSKLVVIITLSWYLEKCYLYREHVLTLLGGGVIVGIPFVLIFKQPDLGTSMVLFPITLVMFYLGGIKPWVVNILSWMGLLLLCAVALLFLEILSHEQMRPYVTTILKEYQYERLNPHTHHLKAALIALGSGGIWGKGWRQSEFTARGYLPESHTDSVFPAFGEEFGFVGLVFLMALFYALIYFSFQVTAVAKDPFGRLLSAGVTIYLASQILVNIGMMCGLLPITGFPLILITYGGSSILFTMAALGILQSIYSRRFMF